MIIQVWSSPMAGDPQMRPELVGYMFAICKYARNKEENPKDVCWRTAAGKHGALRDRAHTHDP